MNSQTAVSKSIADESPGSENIISRSIAAASINLPSYADRPKTGLFTESERIAYLKRHGGHVLSFCSMQPDMCYFDMPGIGYISYMKNFTGKPFILGDPVCSPEHFGLMLGKFLGRYPNAVFCQVSKPVMQCLHDNHHYYGTQMGSQSTIDLANWNLKGKKKQVIRTAVNQAKKSGVVVHESFCENHTREISENWIKTRKVKSHEIRFLIRPMMMSYSEGVRRFYAWVDDNPVGFVFFDPVYENNEVVSYVPNISRSSVEFNQGLFYTIMSHAMEIFQAEGLKRLDLGFIPMSMAKDDEPQESRLVKKAMRLCYEHANFLYNFKGIEFTKSRFRGEVERTYICHKRAVPVFDFVGMFRILNII
ncbi:MAG: hypothetical protein CSB48_04750 [Proteobacteria bacterium]|nr:MAG: hypothetical protein CSB48_04750 [Pseudomonadota bacterium]